MIIIDFFTYLIRLEATLTDKQHMVLSLTLRIVQVFIWKIYKPQYNIQNQGYYLIFKFPNAD